MPGILFFQTLESRLLMASDWYNASLPCDVDQSGLVSPLDVLVVVNKINRDGIGVLPTTKGIEDFSVDVDNDNILSPLDVLAIVNVINRNPNDLSIAVGSSASSDPNGNGVILGESMIFVGQSGPLARITATWPDDDLKGSIVVNADLQGRFQMVLQVEPGVNRVRLDVLDELGRKIHSNQEIRRGDVVADWNAAVLNVVRGWTTTSNDPYEGRIVPSQPPMVARNLAMIQTALFDAINAIDGTHHGYALDMVSQPSASAIAAGASAAYEVAVALYPGAKERAIWDASLMESLAKVPDGDAKNQGIALGRQAASAMLTKRANDLRDAVSAYTPVDIPGHWNRTAPDSLPPLLPQWPSLKPFALTTGSQFRPEAPPSLSSDEYAQAVDQVMALGGINSTVRTAEQTTIAMFWADGAGTATPPGHWNRIASDVLLERNSTLVENARIMAILNLAMADAGIASWDAKYHYDLWRPIDAIRQADQDNNNDTMADPTWIPLLKTPPFPAYTSGHSTFSGAAATVLTDLLGNNVSFESSIDPQNAPSQRPLAGDQLFSRTFTSFHQAAAEAGVSRIYGGIHYAFDNEAGLVLGSMVATLAMQELLTPKL